VFEVHKHKSVVFLPLFDQLIHNALLECNSSLKHTLRQLLRSSL